MKTALNFFFILIIVTAWQACQCLADENWADVLCSYEHGLYPNTGYTNPEAVFSAAAAGDDSNGLVSLGQWTDDPAQGNNTNPVGIILGFSTSILNGAGNDIKIQGNAMFGWWEPGYVEVARETSGSGATATGWTDETWYLLKPSNYDELPHDPRTGPIDIAYSIENLYSGENPYTDSYWSSNTMTGYADVAVGGDYMDISWAIDMNGVAVELTDIAYVRIHSVSNSLAGSPLDQDTFMGGFSADINYVEFLNGIVESSFLTGDANHDGVVSAGDYASVQANFGNVGPGIMGDANGDGVVSAGDYASVQANFGNVASMSMSIPEPSTLLLLFAVGILRKRKFIA